jgi:hypothetical protein
MTKDKMIARFEKEGYKVVFDMGGKVLIVRSTGASRSFNSVTAAFRFYFR